MRKKTILASVEEIANRSPNTNPSITLVIGYLTDKHMSLSDLKIAVVCSSNQNRSMEAHNLLQKRGFNIKSFGSGSYVKLPGASLDKPIIYGFDVTYDEMYQKLVERDKDLYTSNGVLSMLDRNRRIKPRPEKIQETTDHFDLLICCEERVFDQVLDDLSTREKRHHEPVHVINFDIQDNHNDATIGALLICDFCEALRATDDLDSDIGGVIEEFERRNRTQLLHSIEFL